MGTVKTLTKEDLEQSKVPPAKKGDVRISFGRRWILPDNLVWKRNPRWPSHQGYWSLDIPDYRYGVFSVGDQIETMP